MCFLLVGILDLVLYLIKIERRKMSMASKPKAPLKPGTQTPRSGQYEIVGPRGGRTGQEVTSVNGKPLPPTPKPRQSYVLVDPTK
jgi:hypothetical protein